MLKRKGEAGKKIQGWFVLPKFSLSLMPPGFFTGSTVGEDVESGSGVRAAEVGRGIRILAPWRAVDGRLADEAGGFGVKG